MGGNCSSLTYLEANVLYIYYFICDIPEVGIAKKHPARFAFEIYDFTRNACMSANMIAIVFDLLA